jgi:hypothetical protein
MTDTFTYYAIYSQGLYWTNLGDYGMWHERPRLWSRKADAKQCLRFHQHKPAFRYAIVIPMEVKPL